MIKTKRSKIDYYELKWDDFEYYINFIDSKHENQKVQLSKELFLTFNQFILEDIKMMHFYERHIEHSFLTEENIYHRSLNETFSLEEHVIQKIVYEELYQKINLLSPCQKRRLIAYYFQNKTLKEIAIMEKCSIHSVYISIDTAIKKLRDLM